MKVLALNYGSSSIKFLVTETSPGHIDPKPLARGHIDGIGSPQSAIRFTRPQNSPLHEHLAITDHRQGMRKIFDLLDQYKELTPSTLEAAGHRFVHGGDALTHPVVVDEKILSALEEMSNLAPIHNPLALKGIRETRTLLGEQVPMVCIFDTTFHQTMPPVASTYAIPHELASRHRMKRYGFHGIAHASLVQGYLDFVGSAHWQDRLILLHLGSGCSITAVAGGRSVDTSMGWTPLEGLVMGTRSGDLDPAVVPYLAEKEGVACAEVVEWLHQRSGLLGVSGKSADMRILFDAMNQEHDERAALAIELFCYRARKYVGAYLAALGGADAVIFGGGIGESSPEVRQRICTNMAWCGLHLDPARNRRAVGLAPGKADCISPTETALPAYVVAVDEETTIAWQTMDCLTGFQKRIGS